MKKDGKTVMIINFIVMLCIFISGGIYHYYGKEYDLKSTITVLGVQALLIIGIGLVVFGLVILVMFLSSKIKH